MESDVIVMEVSPFSNIGNKLTFLANALQNKEEADTECVFIECYTERTDTSQEQIIRLRTKNGIWTKLNPYDKENGKILNKNIAVNLFQLNNIIEQCNEELISLWIDNDSNELVINSFYNETKDIDELEVRLKISEIEDSIPVLSTECDQEKITTITLNSMNMVTLINELNTEKKADDINLIVKDNKLKFQSFYGNDGFISSISLKTYDMIECSENFTVCIPFSIFNLMASTGDYHDLNINIYKNISDKKKYTITMQTDEYSFSFDAYSKKDEYDFMDSYEDFFIIDSKLIEANIKLFNRLTYQLNISEAIFEKVNDGEMDISSINDKYSVSIRTDLAALSDKKIYIDSRLFESMINKTMTDAIKVQVNKDNNIYITYENGIIVKEMLYKYNIFSSYRTIEK